MLLIHVRIMFSIATNKIDSAMIGSTTGAGATITFFKLRASVTEWATVKAGCLPKNSFYFIAQQAKACYKSI